MNRVLCVLIIMLMCMMSTVGVCKLTPTEVGQQDAQQDVLRPKWFLAGCLSGGFFLWLINDNSVARDAKKPPEVDVKNVPSLLGKPPEYVEKYIVSYQAESVRLRYRWAEYGRVTGSGLTVTIILGFMLGWFSVEI